MKFREACAPYFKSEHPLFMSNKPGGLPDGNTLLYTSLYLLIAKKLGHSRPPEDRAHLREIIDISTVYAGVLSRGPHKMDELTTKDDYIGVTAACQIYSVADAAIFYGYWRNKFKLLKYPGVVQSMALCEGEGLSLWGKILWSADIFFTTFSEADDTSGRILDFIKIEAYRRSDKDYWLCNWAVGRWRKDISKRYPQLLGELFSVYFSKHHPFAVYLANML